MNRSKRNFGEIKTWHEDVGKPYRMAENLRFWVKASELRWEIKLDVPALNVVNGKEWRKFGDAILQWSQGVRRELMEEWAQEALNERRKPPELKVVVPDGHGGYGEEVLLDDKNQSELDEQNVSTSRPDMSGASLEETTWI